MTNMRYNKLVVSRSIKHDKLNLGTNIASLSAVYDQEQSYLQSIKAANKAASAAMMQLMLKDVDLSEVLQVKCLYSFQGLVNSC